MKALRTLKQVRGCLSEPEGSGLDQSFRFSNINSKVKDLDRVFYTASVI